MPVRYRALAIPDRRMVTLDALSALYDTRSGQTHLLAQPMPQILAALDPGPADADELLLRLAEAHDIAPASDAAAVIAARLAELVAIGLAEAV